MNSSRYYYIDALRVIAILMMFIFHVSMVFVAEWGWHIKNSETSYMLLEINFWMSSFRMPLLFFVSGYISYILMQRFDWKAFTSIRFKRLIIPTFVWTFILVAPQIFFELRLRGEELTYFEFYQSFLKLEWWPQGNFHWLHLWFIPYLFCYNLLSMPIHHFLNQKTKHVEMLGRFFNKKYALFVFVFIAILPYAFLEPHFSASYNLINDTARHSFFIFFILAGLLFFRFQQLSEYTRSNRRFLLCCAFITILALNIIRWNGLQPNGPWNTGMDEAMTYLFNALMNLNTWMWVFALLGYGKEYIRKGSKLLTYANTAVYPFYILHQTVIVVIAYYVVQTNDNISLKFGFLLCICFVVIMMIYHLFIRPFNPVRFLFGMKPIKRELKENVK